MITRMYQQTKQDTELDFSLSEICAVFEVSRQAHYQKLAREGRRLAEEQIVLELVQAVRRKHPRMGGLKTLHKIEPDLAAQGIQMGRDRFFELLGQENLLIERKKAYRRTTRAGLWRASNRLSGQTISQPNQVWVCDITYLTLQLQRFAYLFLIMDLYSRFIVGWHVGLSLAAEEAIESLEMALSYLPISVTELIHHSDRGVQYTSYAYLGILQDNNILPSMGAVGNCYDNIYAERVIGILKDEYWLDSLFVDLDQLQPAVAQAVTLYNTDRPHRSLCMATPQDIFFHHQDHAIQPVVIPNETDLTTPNP